MEDLRFTKAIREYCDYIERHCACVPGLRREVAKLRNLLREISEPTFTDERMRYVDVQMTKDAYREMREYLEKP